MLTWVHNNVEFDVGVLFVLEHSGDLLAVGLGLIF